MHFSTKITQLLFCISSFFIFSCTTPLLSVRSDYYNKKNLASCVVDTPDPRKDHPYYGQRIYINWALPFSTLKKAPCTLRILYRVNKSEEEGVEEHAITNALGSSVFRIGEERYKETGGLLSYKIAIIQEGKEIAVSKHKFWVEKITLKE